MRSPTSHDVPTSPRKYQVAIIETLRRVVEVEADDQQNAEQMVSDGWHNSEYILEAEDFVGVEFKTIGGQLT